MRPLAWDALSLFTHLRALPFSLRGCFSCSSHQLKLATRSYPLYVDWATRAWSSSPELVFDFFFVFYNFSFCSRNNLISGFRAHLLPAVFNVDPVSALLLVQACRGISPAGVLVSTSLPPGGGHTAGAFWDMRMSPVPLHTMLSLGCRKATHDVHTYYFYPTWQCHLCALPVYT